MDLSTTYLGFKLAHPLMAGASPMAYNLDTVRRLEDAGCAAIVMPSLFEEQIKGEEEATVKAVESASESFAEARTYLPAPDEFVLGPDEYLEQIRKIKQAVKMPVFASLNGTTPGGWLDYAKLMEQAGADALELNIYELATDLSESGVKVEARALEVVKTVRQAVKVPVAVKLSPFYSCIAHFAKQLDGAGADGLVLFNRLYQPDIDPEELEVKRVALSDPAELLLRLRWIAILSGRVECSLAATGGVHNAMGAIKAVMAGAHAVQMVAALLQRGPNYLATVREAMVTWMQGHEYESLQQMQGSMNLLRCPDAKAYERANYMRMLQSWAASTV